MWLGEAEDKFVSTVPSPQLISYLRLAPPPTVVMVSVTDNPKDPDVLLAVKLTDFTYVPALILSITSLRSSMASVTLGASPKVNNAPSPNPESSVVPNDISLPNAELETLASKYLLVNRSSSPTGSAACILVRVTPDKSVLEEPSAVVVPTLKTSLVSSQ